MPSTKRKDEVPVEHEPGTVLLELHEEICGSINDLVVFIDRTGTVIDVNPRVENLLGYSQNDVIGRNVLKLGVLSSREIPRIAKLITDAVMKGKESPLITLELIRKDGTTVPVEASNHLVRKSGSIIGAVGILRDITARKHVEEELERHRDHLQQMVDERVAELQAKTVELEREVTERGMRGVNLQPFSYRVMAADKRFYPLYQKCQELGVPVTIHTSINFSNDRSIEYGRPLPLCEIACDFPDLTIIANHGGWPWVAELVGVAWKHRNVYIEIGAVAPKYIGTPGGGWETLLQFGNSLLQDQVLFATDNMIPFERAVSELKELPLKPAVMKKWLGGNAASLLGL